MSKKFWSWRNATDGKSSELVLDGPISSETWFGDEITPKMFREELSERKNEPLTVILNSGGGDVFAGMSIYNSLRELESDVTVRVDGLAASIASVIAMAADKVIMSPGSMMMIHKPWTVAMGDTNELEKVKKVLQSIEESILPIYVNRTGKSKEDVAIMLESETWMTAEEAVAEGFADEYIEAKQKVSFADSFKQFNQQLAVSMSVTESAMKDFKQKVSDEADEEVSVEEAREELGVDQETIEKAIAENVTSIKEVSNLTYEVTVDKDALMKQIETITKDKETIEMSKQDDHAVEAIVKAELPTQQAPVLQDYLKTDASINAYARILEANAGREASDVNAAWEDHLKVEMGVTNPEKLLPTALITEIQDAFKEGGEIFNLVDWTGLDVYNTAWDTVIGEDSRAKGYNRADEATKAEEKITIADRLIRPQFIYKYITLNKEDVKAQRSTGALVRYVLSELPRRVIREVERAIVIGDGRGAGTDYKITSFISLKADAAAANGFAATYTPGVGESSYETVIRAQQLADADGAQYLIAKRGFLTDLRLMQGVNGGYIFAPGTDVGSAMGFAGVITPDWLDDTSDAANDAYILTVNAYKGVGDRSVEAFTNFVLSTNKNEYLQEIWAGGGLAKRNSAVAIVGAGSSS